LANVYLKFSIFSSLERYIFALGDYIRKIQEEEAQIMNQFSTRLTKLKGKSTRNRIEAEEEARTAFEQDIEKIRSQRRLFRSMKHDAIKERQKLLDSLALQKEDEELLRQKVRTCFNVISISSFYFSFSKSKRFQTKKS
jgi:hypothetical protein